MAAYFHGSSAIQTDNHHHHHYHNNGMHHMSTLYLMNPTASFFPYSDADPNSSSTRLLDAHAPPDHHHHMYGSWGGPVEIHETAAQYPAPSLPPQPLALVSPSFVCDARQEGLSLTLSSRRNPGPCVSSNSKIVSYGSGNQQYDHSSAASNGGLVLGVQSGVVSGSRYLKAAQNLLDEIVNVGKGGIMKIDSERSELDKSNKMKREPIGAIVEATSGGGSCGDPKPSADLTLVQKQELQMKKAKLVNMIEEVEQRYRQYNHQMQMVAWSFEHDAGVGSSKSYTVLALQTISKKFRCLKDAISGQIKAVNKTLGEENCLGAKAEGSRLRYVDQYQIRQQRAIQQFGMIQQSNAWRPQRGLPERAVSILRAWLFEHFLHPYPRDSDKQILAKQTGLTRSQVSNWFINARVRLWKPMVEEMYLEEMKEHEAAKASDEDRNTTKESAASASPSKPTDSLLENSTRTDHHLNNLSPRSQKPENTSTKQHNNNNLSNSPRECTKPIASSDFVIGGRSIQLESGFNLVEMERFSINSDRRSPKKLRSNVNNVSDAQNSPSSVISVDMDANRGFNTIGEIRSFSLGHLTAPPRGFHGSNGVSLSLSLSEHQQSFLPGQNMNTIQFGSSHEFDFCGLNGSQPLHSSAAAYQTLDVHGSRKRYGSQFLPDFMA